MTDFPHVVDAVVIEGHCVQLTFDDGTAGIADLTNQLIGPVFKPLRDPAFFSLMSVDQEAGTIVWPNGADIAPETLYDLAHGEEPGAWWIRATAELEQRKARKKHATA